MSDEHLAAKNQADHPAETAEIARKSPPAARPPRSSLPFFLLNLVAVYLPGLLPAYFAMQEEFDGVVRKEAIRDAAIDFLNAPYALMSLFTDGGMFVLAAWLGNLGSFYLFLFGLWFVIFGLSIAYAQDKHRYRLTFLLFVLFALQSVYFTRQAQFDKQAAEEAPQLRDDEEEGPALPGGGVRVPIDAPP